MKNNKALQIQTVQGFVVCTRNAEQSKRCGEDYREPFDGTLSCCPQGQGSRRENRGEPSSAITADLGAAISANYLTAKAKQTRA
jgi:hypothetical protein